MSEEKSQIDVLKDGLEHKESDNSGVVIAKGKEAMEELKHKEKA